MSLGQLLQLIWSGRWRLLVCTLAALIGTLAISLRLPKAYEAKARVLLEVVQQDPVTGVSYDSKTSEPYIRTQAILATSARVSEAVIDKLGWTSNPVVIDLWQAQTGGSQPIRAWAAQRLLGQAYAYPLEGGGTLEIAYRAADPDAAETITRAFREAYIETALALQTEAATRRADEFAKLLTTVRRDYDTAQTALIRVQRETGTVLTQGGRDIEADRIQDLANRALSSSLAAQRQAASVGTGRDSLVMATARQNLLAVEQQLALAANTLGTDNPTYRQLLLRRGQVMAQMTRAAAEQRRNEMVLANTARLGAEQPAAAYDAERERLLNRGETNLKVEQAKRLVDLRQGEVNRLAANLAAARQSSERTESGLVVMGDVITNPKPVSPNFPLNITLALAFGFGLGLASVMIDGLARREVLGKADLAGAAGVPVLAVVPGKSAPRRNWLKRLSWRRRRQPALA